MRRVLLNLVCWVACIVVLAWLACCSGCVVWHDLEGNTYLSSLLTDPRDDHEEDPLWQIQLNHPTHYRIKGEQ